MFENSCPTCQDMALSEYGIEEPHEAHMPWSEEPMGIIAEYDELLCWGCDSSEPRGEWVEITGMPYCTPCGVEYYNSVYPPEPPPEEGMPLSTRQIAVDELINFLIGLEDEARRWFVQTERWGDRQRLHAIADVIDLVIDNQVDLYTEGSAG